MLNDEIKMKKKNKTKERKKEKNNILINSGL